MKTLPSPLPSKDAIRQWITENPGLSAKRDIAKAFGIKGDARIELKAMLRALEREGVVEKTSRRFHEAGTLPPVAVLQVLPPDAAGDLYARPLEEGIVDAPRILIIPQKGDPALGAGDRILARLAKVDLDDYVYEARLIRALGSNPAKVLGVFRSGSEGGRIVPVGKGDDKEWRVSSDLTMGAKDGELVEAEAVGARRLGLPAARVVARLGDPSGPRAASLIAIHQHGIPDSFPDAVIVEADRAEPVGLKGREDLRGLPLVTIDPVDARDRDDAVLAEVDTDPGNPGGFILWVAIADVAHYVTPGSALDREARKRGNSTYFPDRVVPMLPDILSGDLCSLHEGVDRACLAVRMVIDADGQKRSHRFLRGLMRSVASLHYAQVQAAVDGTPDAVTAPLLEPVLQPLYAAYAALVRARSLRQPLDLDLPERKIVLDDAGKVASVAFKDRLEAHKLIEECMILANVAAAEELIRLKRPLLFRVHEEPSPLKLDSLREVAEGAGLTLAKGQVLKTQVVDANHFNVRKILKGGAKHHAADAAKTIDTYFDRHDRFPLKLNYFLRRAACTVSATFSGVKPKCLNSTGAGADSPYVSMPTTAAQPYFHQPSVLPISTAMRGSPLGKTSDLYSLVWRSKVVVLGIETTRTPILRLANKACACKASCTSEPVAMITALVLEMPTREGSAKMYAPRLISPKSDFGA